MHPNTPQPTASASLHGAVAHSAQGQPSRLIRLPAVESLTGLKRSSIYALMRARSFPGSVRLSARAVAWRETDVLAWCAGRSQTGGGHV